MHIIVVSHILIIIKVQDIDKIIIETMNIVN